MPEQEYPLADVDNVRITLTAAIDGQVYDSVYAVVTVDNDKQQIRMRTNDDEYLDWLGSLSRAMTGSVMTDMQAAAARLGLTETFEMLVEEMLRGEGA